MTAARTHAVVAPCDHAAVLHHGRARAQDRATGAEAAALEAPVFTSHERACSMHTAILIE